MRISQRNSITSQDTVELLPMASLRYPESPSKAGTRLQLDEINLHYYQLQKDLPVPLAAVSNSISQAVALVTVSAKSSRFYYSSDGMVEPATHPQRELPRPG